MKKAKKILALLLTSVLALSLIGCGKNDAASTKANGEKVTNAADKEGASDSKDTPAGEKVKITYSMWGSAEEGATTQKVADKFNASQDRIEVEVVAIP